MSDDTVKIADDVKLGKNVLFFGWANLTNTPTGGFLGLPGSDVAADMRVVDVYRRDGDNAGRMLCGISLTHH